ncbi:MAG: DUF2330 domain-containing protein [Myxococcota bacterium]
MRVGLLFPVVAVLFDPCSAAACILVADKPIAVSGEEVLLVWDEATKSEELIRYIDFRGDAEDFGFVVPTPGEPTIRTLNSRTVFETLTSLYRGPKLRSEVRGLKGRAKASGGVQVVSRVSLPAAGQTATVLAADNAGALNAWLAEHNYPASAALEAYYRPYVEGGYYFTAFRYTKGRTPRSRGAVVSLSFKSDALFFPYAEPKSGRPSRPFRLSVLARAPVLATVGAKPWKARIGFRGQISTETKYQILSASDTQLPGDRWFLTTFDEPRSRRGRDDLLFSLNPDAQDVPGRLKTIIGARPDYIY